MSINDLPVLETIRNRRSVRTFDGAALSSQDAQKILEYAQQAANPYGIPVEWKLLDAKKYGLSSPVIVGTDTYIAGKMRRVPHAEEAFGYTFEQVVLFAQSLGIGTTWIAGTMNRSAFEKAMELAEDEVMPCVSPLGRPAKKLLLREGMMRKAIKADDRFDFGKIFFEASFDRPLTKEAAGRLADAFEAVRLGPSAVNKQPWRAVLCGDKVHFYEDRNRGYTEGSWDVQKIDMGIALCHFELAAKEAGLSVSLETDDSRITSAGGLVYIASFNIL